LQPQPVIEQEKDTMIKLYDLVALAASQGGETVLGLRDLGTHACYLIYGRIEPGEEPRLLKPGEGHEEIFLVISGIMSLKGPGVEQIVSAGHAFHLQGAETWQAAAMGPKPVLYVAGGGHNPGQEHQH